MRNLPSSKTIIQLIHDTPVVQLKHLSEAVGASIFAKLEFFNPGGTIKDRVALAMIEAAEDAGVLRGKTTLVEATSGSMGVAMALVGSAKGFQVTLVVREGVGRDKIKLMKLLGAKVVLTAASDGIQGSINSANQIVSSDPKAVYLNQFDNDANWIVHRDFTACELHNQIGGLDVLCVGAGSGGTLRGLVEFYRKSKTRSPKFVLVEPVGSLFSSSTFEGSSAIEGIGTSIRSTIANEAFVSEAVDHCVQVKDEDAFQALRRVAKSDGLLGGSSTGAVVHAAMHVGRQMPGARIAILATDAYTQHASTLPARLLEAE